MNFNFSDQTKGICYLAGGLIALFYTFGWFQAHLYYLMLTGAIVATAYGFIKSGLLLYVQHLIQSFTITKQ